MNKPIDVVGFGSAIVDVLSHVDEEFLVKNNLNKGGMELVDVERSREVYEQLGRTMECSGGSVANTLAGMASLGAKTRFIGKVADDQMGEIFAHDMRAIGVEFSTGASSEEEPATASCLVCVTPDAQRTMSTYLGACTLLSEEDVNETQIADAKILYIEGYQWDMENAKKAIRKAIDLAKKNDTKVAFTLSDTFCVARFREEFKTLIQNDIDILFANETELLSLTESDDLNKALEMVKGQCEVITVTRSEKGAVILTAEGATAIPAVPVAQLVDTTGAGDLFASGFLYGFTHGYSLPDAVALGNRCAGQIIQQLGARAMKTLKQLVA